MHATFATTSCIVRRLSHNHQSLGLFVSAFAKTQFQAVQFMPALVLSQILVYALFVSLVVMPYALKASAYYIPLTYVIDLPDRVVIEVDMSSEEAWSDVWVITGGFIVAVVILGALMLYRRIK
ncbi:MAG: ABC transporter permease [Candidatus Saccharimonadales bacterium]